MAPFLYSRSATILNTRALQDLRKLPSCCHRRGSPSLCRTILHRKPVSSRWVYYTLRFAERCGDGDAGGALARTQQCVNDRNVAQNASGVDRWEAKWAMRLTWDR